MHTQPQPDPADVARGKEIILWELDRALIMPRPAATVRAILRLIESARTVLSAPTPEGMSEYVTAAGVAISLVDGIRRELALLGPRP
jgi:hypothetical protein